MSDDTKLPPVPEDFKLSDFVHHFNDRMIALDATLECVNDNLGRIADALEAMAKWVLGKHKPDNQ